VKESSSRIFSFTCVASYLEGPQVVTGNASGELQFWEFQSPSASPKLICTRKVFEDAPVKQIVVQRDSVVTVAPKSIKIWDTPNWRLRNEIALGFYVCLPFFFLFFRILD
jgi:hypothetical protein